MYTLRTSPLFRIIEDAEQIIGFDPYLVLADYVSDQLKPVYEFDLAPGALD